MRLAIGVLAAFLLSSPLLADDDIVQIDRQFDFSTVHAFIVRDVHLASARQELSNTLVGQNLVQAVKSALSSHGLKESSTDADVVVQISISSDDYNVGSGGRANRIEPGRRGRGAVASGPPDFSEGALVIDLTTAKQPGLLVWRGVYRDTEKNISKMVQKLPDDARKLLASYPRKGNR